MFRVSYINNFGQIAHKGGFRSDKEANIWVREQGNEITPLKLLIWSEEIQCYMPISEY